MKRSILLSLLVLLVLAPVSAGACGCTGKHRCAKTLTATRYLRHGHTPQSFAANASVEVRAWARGHRLRVIEDGLTVVFLGRHGLILKVRAERARGPLHFAYVANRRVRLRVAYWAD